MSFADFAIAIGAIGAGRVVIGSAAGGGGGDCASGGGGGVSAGDCAWAGAANDNASDELVIVNNAIWIALVFDMVGLL